MIAVTPLRGIGVSRRVRFSATTEIRSSVGFHASDVAPPTISNPAMLRMSQILPRLKMARFNPFSPQRIGSMSALPSRYARQIQSKSTTERLILPRSRSFPQRCRSSLMLSEYLTLSSQSPSSMDASDPSAMPSHRVSSSDLMTSVSVLFSASMLSSFEEHSIQKRSAAVRGPPRSGGEMEPDQRPTLEPTAACARVRAVS